MSSTADFAQFIADQCSGAGEISFKKMFGEYGLYCDGTIFGLVCDDCFFLKPAEAVRPLLRSVELRPPYEGARDYFLVADLDDHAYLSSLVRATCEALRLEPPRAAGGRKGRAAAGRRAGAGGGAAAVLRDLRAAATPEKAAVLPRFFKTGPGEYGEGDRFLGVMVPQIRAVAKAHADADDAAIRELLDSPWHEARECALLLLVARFGRASAAGRAAIHRLYLAAAAAGRVNNWDLVDLSAPTLVGRHLLDRPRGLLDRLARRPSLWENRIAVVSTLAFIRRGDLADAFRQCAAALGHPHDLMHKAVGWMLRECGKRDPDALRAFLRARWSALPRTTLRYAIERFPPDERARWLAGPVG